LKIIPLAYLKINAYIDARYARVLYEGIEGESLSLSLTLSLSNKLEITSKNWKLKKIK
jgi:hypothetical protein